MIYLLSTANNKPWQNINCDFNDLFLSTSLSFTQSHSLEEDEWIDSAVSCLDLHPSGGEVLNLSFSEDTVITQKLRMYQAIVDYYSGQHGRFSKSYFQTIIFQKF